MQAVTLSLSPVRIFVVTPYSDNDLIAAAAESLGGSRNARYHMRTISVSSFTEKESAGEGLVF